MNISKKRRATKSRRVLRFHNLRDRGIVPNRVTMGRWQETEGFPMGVVLASNSVGFFEDEIEAWLDARPRQHSDAVTDRDQERADRLRDRRKPSEADETLRVEVQHPQVLERSNRPKPNRGGSDK
jgi:hypothetical protein